MKIINFGVNNYRCISGGTEQNTVNFEDSNTIFIFGQNNTGKSSFLNAYVLFYEDQKVQKTDFFNEEEGNTIEIIIEVELSEEEKQQLKEKRGNAEKKYFYGDNHNQLTFKKVWGRIGAATNNLTLLKDKSGFDDIGYAGVGEHKVFKNMLPKPIFIEAMPEEQGVEDVVNEILSIRIKEFVKNKEEDEYKEAYNQAETAIKNFQKLLYGHQRIADYKQEVNKNFNSMFEDITLNITEKDVDITKTIEKKFTIRFDYLHADKTLKSGIPHSFDNIGHGAIRVALFSLFLVKDIADVTRQKKEGKNYLVLFEEPELFLHPKLTKQLRETIYAVSGEETAFQVVCASHSPIVCQVVCKSSVSG